MRTGIIGGTFDPIHYGHLLLAETARDFLKLDRVIFVPAGVPPHKRDRQISSGADRAAMIQLAIAGYPEFELSRFEIDTEGVSWTVLTLRHFRQIYPDDSFFLIIGSETLSDLSGWYKPEELCRLASPAAAHRAGMVPPQFGHLTSVVSQERLDEFRKLVIPMPQIELSSTEIRNRVREGRSIRFLTPEKTVDYICKKGLYRSFHQR